MRWPAIFFPQKAEQTDAGMAEGLSDSLLTQPPITRPRVRYLPPHQHLSAEPVFSEIVFTPITWIQAPPIKQRPGRFIHPAWHIQADPVLTDEMRTGTVFLDAWHQPAIIQKPVRYMPPHQYIQAGPVLTDAMRPETIFIDAWHQPPVIKKRYPEFYIRGPLNDSSWVFFEGLVSAPSVYGWFSREILPPGYRLVGMYRNRGYIVTYVFTPSQRSGNPLLLVI